MKLDKKNECDVRVDGVNHKRVLEDVLDGVGVLVLCYQNRREGRRRRRSSGN